MSAQQGALSTSSLVDVQHPFAVLGHLGHLGRVPSRTVRDLTTQPCLAGCLVVILSLSGWFCSSLLSSPVWLSFLLSGILRRVTSVVCAGVSWPEASTLREGIGLGPPTGHRVSFVHGVASAPDAWSALPSSAANSCAAQQLVSCLCAVSNLYAHSEATVWPLLGVRDHGNRPMMVVCGTGACQNFSASFQMPQYCLGI